MRELAKYIQEETTSRILFPKSETKTKGTLELIHSDVCGPMPSTFVSGFEYFVGNQSERRIKTLRTDNGGE